MRVYRVEVDVQATAYIRANDEHEARLLLREHILNGTMELPQGNFGVEISGKQYDDPTLPVASLSPAMTVDGQGWGDLIIEDTETELP